ncbi:TolC family protein [Sphingomonas changnyeongensis]|uniref:TolC family protein n=1 Tax=Sphingomonas changnyeongensis TaxID=2698679 RepID=A0A7Z2NWM3_9SPHN|nr:TolC family protein [Sphingomonas changnyeongensis]QHL91145.1 TolC family protein [Sphingomonas changnyeongensis]
MMPFAISLIVSVGVQMSPPPAEPGMPLEAAVERALDSHPMVIAAHARVDEARADAQLLAVGPQEVVVQGTVQRRDVRGIGMVPEYDLQFTRPIRLPGKAALDRRVGNSGLRAAENRAEDARHQAALLLSKQWWTWLGAASEARTLEGVASVMSSAVAATRKRLALRDASALELDQALSAEAAAHAGAMQASAREAAARAALSASFPDLPLPSAAPALPRPALPAEGSEGLAALVIARSHEIGASAADLDKAEALRARAARDRLADPSIGLRAFSEQGGNEKGIGLIFSVPLGGRARAAAVDRASSASAAAAAELAATRNMISALAAEGAALATGYLRAWEQALRAAEAAQAAAERQRAGHALGGIDLSDRLVTERLACDAALEEVRARTAALEAITRLRIDAHTLWLSAQAHEGVAP